MDIYRYLKSLQKFGVNLGLDRINFLLARLGAPHQKFRSIHIAGTNGKGSTAAMIASILKEAGYKVGLYTSPHLFDFRERIQINGQMISRQDFEQGLKLVKALKGQPTVFEALTAVAFWYFARQKVDYAVVEVGLGGRLDATNVLFPLVSVITNIDYEHTEILGKTLAKIAAEKAAIIKSRVPVVTAEIKQEPLRVIREVSRLHGSRLIEVGSGVRGLLDVGLEVGCGMVGEHQKQNAACAVQAIKAANIKVSKRIISSGLKKVSWPGRFQIIAKKPLVIVDGAHNPAGIKRLRVTIEERFKHKFTVIFGCQKTKDSKKMIQTIKPIAHKLIITQSSHQQARRTGCSPKQALRKWDGVSPLLVTGSLFLVADFLSAQKLDVVNTI